MDKDMQNQNADVNNGPQALNVKNAQATKAAHSPAQDVDDLAVMAPWLENIAFPKSREAILQFAEENTENDIDDNEGIMERFRGIPDGVYNNVEEIRRALGDTYDNYGGVEPTSKQ